MNIDSIFRSQHHQLAHVGRGRWLHDRSRLFQDESLKPGRGAQYQHSGRGMADDFKSMRDFARSIDEGARASLKPLPAADERYFPFQNVEGLVFPMMRMIRP